MKQIKIDVVTLIGILLLIVGLIVGGIAYYSYNNSECIANPVAYANNYSYNYWWDSVFPINTNQIG